MTKEQALKWLTDSQIRDISGELALAQNPQHLISFQLLLSTGQKFSRLAKARWGAFNARLGIIRIGDRSIRLPANLAQGLEGLRESALAEDDPILTIKYKKFWAVLEKVCVRLGIEPSGVLSLRNTFALRHWQAYQSRARLREDLGLSSLRHLPKEIFQARPQALFQGVI